MKFKYLLFFVAIFALFNTCILICNEESDKKEAARRVVKSKRQVKRPKLTIRIPGDGEVTKLGCMTDPPSPMSPDGSL